MHRYIYGEDPASQVDHRGIVIHELPEIELDNQTPLPLLRDIYALNNTSFDKILDFHTDVLFKKDDILVLQDIREIYREQN